jgi:hypothetical protein
VSPKVFEIENGREIIQYIINHNIIHGCVITKKYAEVDESITIRYYEILSTDPIKIEVNVYRLDNVLRTGQNNSLFGAPFPLSVCVIG